MSVERWTVEDSVLAWPFPPATWVLACFPYSYVIRLLQLNYLSCLPSVFLQGESFQPETISLCVSNRKEGHQRSQACEASCPRTRLSTHQTQGASRDPETQLAWAQHPPLSCLRLRGPVCGPTGRLNLAWDPGCPRAVDGCLCLTSAESERRRNLCFSEGSPQGSS